MSLPQFAMNQPTFPEMYERWLVVPLFRPWAELTLEDLRLSPGDRVLDVACGTGIVARVARERLGDGAYITGVDMSPDMLSVARTVAPAIDWREGDVTSLPLRADEKFDVVVCQQGLQFFEDKAAAVEQMRRALSDGGRLAVSTWRPDEEVPLCRDLRHVAERYVGAIEDKRHSLGDGAAIEALLRGAGLKDVQSRTVSRTIRFEDGARFLRLNTMALVGMSAACKTMDAEERKRIADVIVGACGPVVQPYTDGDALAFELRTNLATAKA